MWDDLRRIIRRWLSAQNSSMRGLAGEAGLPPSVLSRFLSGKTTLGTDSAVKLYEVLHRDMSPLDRRTFLKVAGLLPLVTTLQGDTLFSPALFGEPPGTYGPHEMGLQLMLAARKVARESWRDAVPLYREAERLLGPASSQAAHAGCMLAQTYVNMCDYEAAMRELDRIQQTYQEIMDPETQSEVYRIRGWIAYYRGHFADAEIWFNRCIHLGDETGVARIREKAHHFLGRVYTDWGQTVRQQNERQTLFRNAEAQLDEATGTHLRLGSENQAAFDLLRKAQLRRAQGDWRQAQALRARAEEMRAIGEPWPHLTAEEARAELLNGEVAAPRKLASAAIEIWRERKYPRGLHATLRILGVTEYLQGNKQEAFKLFVAALCVYPYRDHLANRELRELVGTLRDELLQQKGRTEFRTFLRTLREQAETRQGYFAFLDDITVDRSAYIDEIFEALQVFG